MSDIFSKIFFYDWYNYKPLPKQSQLKCLGIFKKHKYSYKTISLYIVRLFSFSQHFNLCYFMFWFVCFSITRCLLLFIFYIICSISFTDRMNDITVFLYFIPCFLNGIHYLLDRNLSFFKKNFRILYFIVKFL